VCAHHVAQRGLLGTERNDIGANHSSIMHHQVDPLVDEAEAKVRAAAKELR
jgi:hypothetical protein